MDWVTYYELKDQEKEKWEYYLAAITFELHRLFLVRVRLWDEIEKMELEDFLWGRESKKTKKGPEPEPEPEPESTRMATPEQRASAAAIAKAKYLGAFRGVTINAKSK